jgi:hypothetical protein
MKYYLMIDNSTQWEFLVVAEDEPNSISLQAGKWDISKVDCDFIQNLCSREETFHSKTFRWGGTYRGWAISEKEFSKIKRLLELKPLVEEFKKLSSYE